MAQEWVSPRYVCVGRLMFGRGLIAFYVPEEEDNNDKIFLRYLQNKICA